MKIIKLSATDSTNTYLKRLVKETELPDETVVHTNHQLSGRGQMGNGWLSREGQSLTFSIFKRFEAVEIDKQFMISMAVSLAISEALKSLNIPDVSIKWPNDILSDNKKIGGILIENVLEGSLVKYSVIGIGLNVNETNFPNLPQASSMKLETGRTFQLDEVFHSVLEIVFKNLQNLSIDDFIEIKAIYEDNLFRKELISVFETPQGLNFNGIIKGVSEIGALLVETENGLLQQFQLKEVKMVY
ncbi:birA, biotin-(acetyl-CoA-carboxylase) ligase [Aequorivita sublithincola DSM 14238]|uniref:BirA, biotin-(Acetyl-CoA-carboxylase) ligase n=1 Tax=Aequorivita sublithincola (strain DSM 14238 / LMG 21431 / ACAM 643 / 9-3) TaxID=746697 RepID=I3YSI3_AEQSU|nr:biotin--[acetyl-CoA-carboxylase] ligase [Aequorivita sublithincola]AFL79951.1 birA, biotin-(acetyl-CoA-carboxylase) ligase [Aequorivita sublithincola DSM 14238]